MPSSPSPKPPTRNKAAIAAVCAGAAIACLPLTRTSEGERLRPYRDPAHIVTWCYGETVGEPKSLYTETECATMLQNRLARDYAPKIAACLPELANERRIKAFAAFLDASYNAGPAAVCKSRMAVSVHAGNWGRACAGFYGWRATAHDRRTGALLHLRGLEIRREKEAALCREGI